MPKPTEQEKMLDIKNGLEHSLDVQQHLPPLPPQASAQAAEIDLWLTDLRARQGTDAEFFNGSWLQNAYIELINGQYIPLPGYVPP